MSLHLELYMEEQLLDRVPLLPYRSQKLFAGQLETLKTELLKKHAATLAKDSRKPVFILSGVPSCMNDFEPLKMK